MIQLISQFKRQFDDLSNATNDAWNNQTILETVCETLKQV